MPLIAFIVITLVVLEISMVGMFTRESVPMLGEEDVYDAFDESPETPAPRTPVITRRA